MSEDLIKEFKDYVWNFYGKDVGLYKDMFENTLTMNQLDEGVSILLKNSEFELEGDTFDREILRDIMLFKFMGVKDLEYDVSSFFP
jgi:hypothetical protein